MSTRLPWSRSIPHYARRLGAAHAHRVAEQVLVLALLAAHVGTRSPAETDLEQIDDFVRTLPRRMRRRAQRMIVRFVASVARRSS